MYRNWLRYADPGLPRRLTYTLMWVLYPFLFTAFAAFLVVVDGISVVWEEIPEACASNLRWLWLQRTTMDENPWKPAR
jgi:uncharacterized membrane protein